MKTIASLGVSILLIAGSLLFAQGRNGVPDRASRLNLAQTQTIVGTVTAVDLAYGTQYPTITVNQTVIKVAPLWFFLEQDFELQVGDSVSVLAASCSLCGDSYLYAITITNTETSATITLRDPSGFPLWSGNGRRPGRALYAARQALRVNPASVQTVSGIVEAVSMGVGIQMPSLTVKTPDGTLVAMRIGPERVLLAADFELKPGEPVTATYATCLRENIALQLTNSAGVTVVLRNPDGTPVWN